MIEHSNLIDKSRLKFSKEKILATSLILPSLIFIFPAIIVETGVPLNSDLLKGDLSLIHI
mgnify:CR=1 FL=1